MVRRNNNSHEFARLWDRLPTAEQLRMLGEVRSALRAATESEHEPVRATHDHYHRHAPDEGVAGLDADGGHAHMHSHGKQPSSDHPPVPDNSHEHPGDHNEIEWGPGEAPQPEYDRPDGLPGATGRYGKHIRFERGGMTVLASARPPRQRPDPQREQRVDAAFALLEQTARRLGQGR